MSWVNLQDAIIDNFKTEPLPIEAGGTGASTAEDARTNLGITPVNIGAAPQGNAVQTWTAAVTIGTWSRLFGFYANTVTGGSFIVNIAGTRGNVVYNVTLLVNYCHASPCNIVQLNSSTYTTNMSIGVRGVTRQSDGGGYLEIYDNISGTTAPNPQYVYVSVIKLDHFTNISKYTSFTDGTTIPTGYTAHNVLNTVNKSGYFSNA